MIKKIAIIGLGYVGLPLARLFATKYSVVGFDINEERVWELNKGCDDTLEVSDELLQSVLVQENPFKNNKNGLYCSVDLEDIKEANIYVVTVPTPVDKNNRPVLEPLLSATKIVAKVLKKDDMIFL